MIKNEKNNPVNETRRRIRELCDLRNSQIETALDQRAAAKREAAEAAVADVQPDEVEAAQA